MADFQSTPAGRIHLLGGRYAGSGYSAGAAGYHAGEFGSLLQRPFAPRSEGPLAGMTLGTRGDPRSALGYQGLDAVSEALANALQETLDSVAAREFREAAEKRAYEKWARESARAAGRFHFGLGLAVAAYQLLQHGKDVRSWVRNMTGFSLTCRRVPLGPVDGPFGDPVPNAGKVLCVGSWPDPQNPYAPGHRNFWMRHTVAGISTPIESWYRDDPSSPSEPGAIVDPRYWPWPYVSPIQNGKVPDAKQKPGANPGGAEWTNPVVRAVPIARPGVGTAVRDPIHDEWPSWRPGWEKKRYLGALRQAVGAIANVVTEPLDELACVHDAIPRDAIGKNGKKKQKAPHKRVPTGRYDSSGRMEFKTVYGRNERGQVITRPTVAQQVEDVVNHIDNIQWGEWAKCSFKNHVMDFVQGKLSSSANAEFMKSFGSRPAGVGAGPVM